MGPFFVQFFSSAIVVLKLFIPPVKLFSFRLFYMKTVKCFSFILNIKINVNFLLLH